jgi:hypothetical protein
MRHSQSLYLALLISILVCCGTDAQSREQHGAATLAQALNRVARCYELPRQHVTTAP